jgi:hypothetical protein
MRGGMPEAFQFGHLRAVVQSFALLFQLLFSGHGGNLTSKERRNEGENNLAVS